jgi:small subunit ribosomal protein S1
VLSYRRARKEKRWQELEKIMNNKDIITGTIIGKNTNSYSGNSYNGYKVNLKDVMGFLPKSQIHGFERIKDKETFGQDTYEFLITQMDKTRDTINVVMLDENIKKHNFQDITNCRIKERDVVEGEVIAIEDYGCFIKINNNYLGFIKINDICSNRRIEHPSEAVTLGEKIKAKVMRVENNRFRCSISLLESYNIEDVKARFKVGEIYQGKISSIVNNGCFVLLDDGITGNTKKKKVDGFVDSSEISWNEADFYRGSYKSGDIIQVKVLQIDDIIALSAKQCDMTPFENFCEQYKDNDMVEVTINYCNRNRAVAEISQNLNATISGFIDKKEFDWDYYSAISAFNKIRHGESYKTMVKIIKLSKDGGRIELSIRRTGQDPVEEFLQKYPMGTIVSAEISHINEKEGSILLSVDKWKNVMVMYKAMFLSPKEKGIIKVKVAKFDRKNRYVICYLAGDRNKPSGNNNNHKESVTSSLGDSFSI